MVKLSWCEEEVIRVYKDWLNAMIDRNDDEGVIPHVTREMFDDFNDPPRTVLNQIVFKGSIYERLYLVMICSPYHDEGGPTILTAIFSLNDYDHAWVLEEVLAEFDTDFELIFHDEKLRDQVS